MVLKNLISTNILNMSNKINLQYLISYFGILPYLLVCIDKYFFFKIEEKILFDFILYYSLIISVFIGSLHWNLLKRISNYKIINGFLPSFYATIVIILNLYNFHIFLLLFSIIILLLLQLFFDFILIFKNSIDRTAFYFLRIPLTILISLFLIILQL